MIYYYKNDKYNRIARITSNKIDEDDLTIELNSLEGIKIPHHGIVNGKIVEIGFPLQEEIDAHNNIIFQNRNRLELREIQEWFNSTDWISNKILTGEWTTEDPRWQQYLMERSIKRNRQDELNALLGDDN